MAGDAEVVSVPELIANLSRIMHRPARIFSAPLSLMSLGAKMLGKEDKLQKLTNDLWIDSSKLTHQLGWTPPLSQLEGLERAVKEIDEHESAAI